MCMDVDVLDDVRGMDVDVLDDVRAKDVDVRVPSHFCMSLAPLVRPMSVSA